VGRAPAAEPAGGQIGFLIVVNILVFLLAFFLDFFELSFIVVPLLGPWRRSSASTSSGSACSSA
jgi:TRAP-type mannitol/chloroaromatic compound transport system permease large subunit